MTVKEKTAIIIITLAIMLVVFCVQKYNQKRIKCQEIRRPNDSNSKRIP